jgi:hypothetical protein
VLAHQRASAAGFALEDRLQTWDDLAPGWEDRREWIRVSR